MLWTLNLSDGTYSLLDIAERAQLKFDAIYNAAVALQQSGLLKPVASESDRPGQGA
jgi:aminopeptidase-like protein